MYVYKTSEGIIELRVGVEDGSSVEGRIDGYSISCIKPIKPVEKKDTFRHELAKEF